MKRVLIAVGTVALLAGCQQEEPKKPMTTTTMEPAKASAVTDAAKSASTAKPPTAKEYYEVTKSGKTYVFGNLDSVLAFRQSGALPSATIEKANFGPTGETVIFEGGGLEAGLMAEYQKSHPKK